MFYKGDTVKFKDYTGTSKKRGKAQNLKGGWTDWQAHKGEISTIVRKAEDDTRFDWNVVWKDKRTSNVDERNLILIKSYADKYPEKGFTTILNEEITKLKGGEN